MVLKSLLAISVGASLGACFRWTLGLMLDAVFPPIPLGTLVANLSGGFLVGIAIGVFTVFPTLAPEWRLLVVTGFLGGLTTFSTFSGEVVALVHQQRFFMAMGAASLHLFGSLAMTFLGIGLVSLARVYR